MGGKIDSRYCEWGDIPVLMPAPSSGTRAYGSDANRSALHQATDRAVYEVHDRQAHTEECPAQGIITNGPVD